MRIPALLAMSFAVCLATALPVPAVELPPKPGDILLLHTDILIQVDPVTLQHADHVGGRLCGPGGLARAADGQLYATNNHNSQSCPQDVEGIYRIDPATGEQSLLAAGNLLAGGLIGIAAAANGQLFVAVRASPSGRIVRVDPVTGAQSLVSSAVLEPSAIALEASGNLLVTEAANSTLVRIDPTTGAHVVVSQGGLLAEFGTALNPRAGGLAIAPNGDAVVAALDEDGHARLVRVDPGSGVQTLAAAPPLGTSQSAPLKALAFEPGGTLLAISDALFRLDFATNTVTPIDVGSSPLYALLVVPQPVNRYALRGLLPPYVAPPARKFEAGSTIPLKWQYTQDDSIIDSSTYPPELTIDGPVRCGTQAAGAPLIFAGPGNRGLTYDSASNTWHLNWKTAKGVAGCFNVVVNQAHLGVREVFPIELKSGRTQ